MTKLKNKVKGTEVPVVDERMILAEHRGDYHGHGASHAVRFDRDSYVIVFSGRRGGGKTTAMSFMVIRACALYRSRLVANFPIEFYIRRFRRDGKSYLEHYKNEPFDFEQLILGDKYAHALLVLDEAPDVISHMASQGYKNRLVAAFVRQLRKNYNTLFMGAQSVDWIDKSMRWQVDIRFECKDLSRSMGDDSSLERGEMIKLTAYDESGQWTGKSTDERIAIMRATGDGHPWAAEFDLFPRFMFGDDEHKPVFDSWHQIDILDSLRRVDLKLSKIQISDTHGEAEAADKLPVSPGVLLRALESLEDVLAESSDGVAAVFQDAFYNSLGLLGDRDKNNLGKVLSKFNIERGRDSGTGKRFLSLNSFDIEGFRGYVEPRLDTGQNKVSEGA